MFRNWVLQSCFARQLGCNCVLQLCVAQEVLSPARHMCNTRLQTTIAKHNCNTQVQHTIAKHNCNTQLQHTIAKPNCKTSIAKHNCKQHMQNNISKTTIEKQQVLKQIFETLRGPPPPAGQRKKSLRKCTWREFRGPPRAHNGVASKTIKDPCGLRLPSRRKLKNILKDTMFVLGGS